MLRALGDVVDACTAVRLDPPAAAAVKGSLRIRRVLARAARDTIPGAPSTLRAMVSGRAVRLESRRLDRVRAQVLLTHHRNSSMEAMAPHMDDGEDSVGVGVDFTHTGASCASCTRCSSWTRLPPQNAAPRSAPTPTTPTSSALSAKPSEPNTRTCAKLALRVPSKR